jgi:hypothetical protein
MSLLATSVHVAGGPKPFGELTYAEVAARAAELRSAVGFGPTARIASVARAWGELGRRMQETGAATVADLDEAVVAKLAEPLWVRMPGSG